MKFFVNLLLLFSAMNAVSAECTQASCVQQCAQQASLINAELKTFSFKNSLIEQKKMSPYMRSYFSTEQVRRLEEYRLCEVWVDWKFSGFANCWLAHEYCKYYSDHIDLSSELNLYDYSKDFAEFLDQLTKS